MFSTAMSCAMPMTMPGPGVAEVALERHPLGERRSTAQRHRLARDERRHLVRRHLRLEERLRPPQPLGVPRGCRRIEQCPAPLQFHLGLRDPVRDGLHVRHSATVRERRLTDVLLHQLVAACRDAEVGGRVRADCDGVEVDRLVLRVQPTRFRQEAVERHRRAAVGAHSQSVPGLVDRPLEVVAADLEHERHGRLALFAQGGHEEVRVRDARRRHERLLHAIDPVAAVLRNDRRLGRARPRAALVPGLAPGDRAQPLAAGDPSAELARLLGRRHARHDLRALDVHLVDQRRRGAGLGQRFRHDARGQQALALPAVLRVRPQAEKALVAQRLQLLIRKGGVAVCVGGTRGEHVVPNGLGLVAPRDLRISEREVGHRCYHPRESSGRHYSERNVGGSKRRGVDGSRRWRWDPRCRRLAYAGRRQRLASCQLGRRTEAGRTQESGLRTQGLVGGAQFNSAS